MKMKFMANVLKNKIRDHLLRKNNQITYVEAKELMQENPSTILLDVRSKQEYDEYHLEGALCIPLYELPIKIENIIENKQQVMIVYCQSCMRSQKAVQILERMGYENLYQIEGGIDHI